MTALSHTQRLNAVLPGTNNTSEGILSKIVSAVGRLARRRRPGALEMNGDAAAEEAAPAEGSAMKFAPRRGCVAYTAESLHEAQLLIDLLDEAGVAATLFNTDLIGAMGELPFSQCWPKIWLADESDLEAANSVIRAYETRKKQPSQGTRSCGACGEDGPENFELCWNCRAPLD